MSQRLHQVTHIVHVRSEIHVIHVVIESSIHWNARGHLLLLTSDLHIKLKHLVELLASEL